LEGLALEDLLDLLLPFSQFSGYLVYFVVIWYIFPPFWYIVSRKNLATLHAWRAEATSEAVFEAVVAIEHFSESGTGLPDLSW
jgi:hypothetical protein